MFFVNNMDKLVNAFKILMLFLLRESSAIFLFIQFAQKYDLN
jgi:hypothetical protein